MSSIYGFFGGSHSASSCLIIDGEIIKFIEEERMTRLKAGDNYHSYPNLSSQSIESSTGLPIHQADYRMFVEPVPDLYAESLTSGNYERVSHHDAHCYGAYFTSGMEGKVLNISYDGGGDFTVMKIYLCEDGKMTLLKNHRLSEFGSLSLLWGFSVSGIMGWDNWGQGNWKMCKDEGKLMGMAPDGEYNQEIYNMLNSCIDYNNLEFFPNYTAFRTKFLVDSMYSKGYFDTQKQREIFCFNLQKLTEDLFLRFLNDLHKLYPEYKQLCFSGGLFANVKLNQKINELDWVEKIYVVPAMGDEGLSLGACIYKSVQLGEITKPFHLKNVFFGLNYNDEEISNLSNDEFIRFPYSSKEIATKLEEGKIIGWFKNGFEMGPRALGGRSILSKPTTLETHNLLNERLNRHDVMPFAPIVMDEYFEEIFEYNKSKTSAQFMTITYPTKESWIPKIPAVIQKTDKTARPQVVIRKNLPEIWDLLNEYYKISGIPVLLNTSFNTHNEPIIDTPQQAFEKLKTGVIDLLVIENYVYQSK